MARWLLAASVAMPAVLGVALWQGVTRGPSTFTTIVYAAASRICHQRPERSFHTAGVQWPVCGRCSGLYVGGALGGLLAGVRLRRSRPVRRLRLVLAVAVIPTALTLALEWAGAGRVGNLDRAVAALPLGAAIALAIISAAEPFEPIR